MKSSKCLFSSTIFKSDIQRFLPFGVPLLIAELILFPVVIFSNFDQSSPLTMDEFASISAVSSGFAFVFAGVMALLVYSYLFTPNKCNALHAFPIGRKALFTTHFISGYLMLVVPQALGAAAMLPVLGHAAARGIPSLLLLQAATVCGESFIYFAIATLAVMLAGNLFAGGVIYFIIHCLYYALNRIFNGAVNWFGYGLEGDVIDSGFGSYLSPFFRLLGAKLEMGVNPEGLDASASGKEYYISLLILIAAAVAVAALAHWLYKIRALECAGDMVAFKAEIPVISVICAVVGGAAFAFALAAILGMGPIGGVVLYAVFSLLFFFGSLMVLKKSAKVFKIKGFIVWLLTVVITVAAAYGMAQYETNAVPKAAAVKQVTVNSTYDVTLTDAEEIKAAEELHQFLIDDRKVNEEEQKKVEAEAESYPDSPTDRAYEMEDSFGINFTYTLKSGRVVQRSYWVYKDVDKAYEMLGALEDKHQPVTVFEKLQDVDFMILSCTVEDYEDMDGEELLLNTDEIKPFWALCAEDTAEASKDYRSGKKMPESEQYSITFNCEVKNAEEQKKLRAIWESNSDVTGTGIYLDGNGTGNTFSVNVYGFPANSKAIDYLKNRK